MDSRLLATALIVCFFVPLPLSARAETKQDFWNRQRAGANCFNQELGPEWFDAARARHLQFIRLTPSKWKAADRDFLIGNADHYQGIPPKDLARLKQVLDMANARGIKVILTPLSLPGDRWLQQNDDKPDHRLWQNKSYQDQAVQFWCDLASSLKDHPAVAAYNIINEPFPERATTPPFKDSLSDGFRTWYSKEAQGTTADLNAFYRRVVSAIRELDKETPIVLDAGQYATVDAFSYLEPIKNDSGIIYSFHQYEPYAYTNIKENAGRFSYPGEVLSDGDKRTWNAGTVKNYLERVAEWARKNHVPSNRILAGEFGVNRVAPGAAQYLADNIAAFNANGWHWAFYSFREDTWEGMDYELGSKRLPQTYFDAKENGQASSLPRGDNSLFEPLKKGLDTVWQSGNPKKSVSKKN